jgi:hypothetical protein
MPVPKNESARESGIIDQSGIYIMPVTSIFRMIAKNGRDFFRALGSQFQALNKSPVIFYKK